MNSFLKSFIVIVAALFFHACKQDKKTTEEPLTPETTFVAATSQARYVAGDSIHIGFVRPIEKADIYLDSASVFAGKSHTDSLIISTKNAKTGWHQLVVKGITASQESFDDTLQIELVSDIIPVEIKYTVLESYPHLETSFTEGLEFHKGELYESTGQNGGSKLMKIDLKTGAVLKSVPLELKFFGEGITIVKDKIYQLTWQSGVGFRRNMDFSLDKTFTYYTEGWGLTHRDDTIIMSDGSSKLQFFNTEMGKIGQIDVYDNKGPVRKLNELEYVEGFIYANIFESTQIVKIDPVSGKVVGFLNMDAMIPSNVNVQKDVLNGIAHKPFENALYLTGKNWPLLFKVKLNVPAKGNLAAR